MKKIRIIALTSLLLIAVMLLVSCGGVMSPDDVIGSGYEHKSPSAYGTLTQLTSLDGMASTNSADQYYDIFRKTGDNGMTTTSVFSKATGAVIATFTNTTSYSYSFSTRGRLLMVTKTAVADSDSEVSVYAPDGTVLTTLDSYYSYSDLVMNSDYSSIILDKVVYTYDSESGKYNKVSELSEFNAAPGSFTEIGNEYIYSISSSRVRVYDLSGSPVAQHYIPSYSVSPKAFVLAEGDVLIQYKVLADKYSDDYDYISTDASEKYDVVTLLLDVSKNKVDEMDCEYIFDSIVVPTANNEYKAYVGSIDNYAVASKIVDRRVDSSENAKYILNVGNNGKVSDVIAENGASAITPIADGNYMIRDAVKGTTVVLDKDFAEIATVNVSATYTGKYFVIDGTVYNTSLTEIYDIASNDTVTYFKDGAILVQKTKSSSIEYILLDLKGEKKTVANLESTSGAYIEKAEPYNYFYKVSDGTYTYYNTNGEKIWSGTKALSFHNATENAIMFSQSTSNGFVWYLAKK